MTHLEDALSRVLSGAADQAPQASAGLVTAVETRHRRRRTRTAALLSATAVVVVAVGAGTAVSALRGPAAPPPATGGTGSPSPGATKRAEPPVDEIPPPVTRVWPKAVHDLPAKLPDGRAYEPQVLLDDRTLLVMTGAWDGKRQFLWRYDLDSGRPTRVAEIPPTKGSAIYADGVAAGGGNIVWWASYKEPGRPRVARIWTVPVAGGRPRPVTDVPLGDVMKEGHINGLAVVGSEVVFAYEKGGVHRVPLNGGRPRPVKGAGRHHVLRWPWVGVHRGKVVFRELLDVETGERRDAVVGPGEEQVRCGVERCFGVLRRDGALPKWFVRDRDGSGERELSPRSASGLMEAGLERFFMFTLNDRKGPAGVALYDADTGRSADLGIRPEERTIPARKVRGRYVEEETQMSMAIPDGGDDRLLTVRLSDRMRIVDLAAID
ncbi:TolB family protein [Streptosporangium sp. NPDC004379]|uniref:TolB family protein n=1 Tax=Streptosporangium sp. NPDC004379 TaxID=3366189 RepID=UPI0036A5A5DB